jgi:hypothetical protein
VGPSPTESHISTFPLGSTAWKIGTTSVGNTELHAPPTPGSVAAALERPSLGTFLSLIVAAVARVCRSISVIGVPTRSSAACSASL